MCGKDCIWLKDEPAAGLINYCDCEEFEDEEVYEQAILNSRICPYYESEMVKEYLYESEYDSMILYASSFNPGDEVLVFDKETQTYVKSFIVLTISRSSNFIFYDHGNLEEFENLLDGKSYNFSGEFILDDDCYYVFTE